jgi:diguanylate cyclase (GGDEF)-like protein
MSDVHGEILAQVIGACREAILLVNLDHPDWPVLLANSAYAEIGGDNAVGRPAADVVEGLVGRELALEISESLRNRQETSYPVDIGGAAILLALKPLPAPGEERARHAALYFRGGAGSRGATVQETQHALLNAKRHIRDLTRDDPVTGLLNERAFRDVLVHDWAVAARERGMLALVLFTLDDFDAYVEVFGRHAADSCLRRVGQAVRRCLRRASDVVARLDGARLVVLSHASDEQSVREFATQIAATVRELGLHHPRSSVARFVTVSERVAAAEAGDEPDSASRFLDALLAQDPPL